VPASPASRTVVAGANGQQARQRRQAKARERGKKGRLPHPSALLAGCIAPMRTGKLRDTSTRGGIRERGLRAANGRCGLTSHRADSYTKHRARGFIRAKPVRVSTASRVAGHASSRRGDSCTLPRPLLARTHALPLIEGHCQDAAVCTPPDRLRAYPRICSSAPFRPIVCPLSYTMCLAPATPPTASPSPAASTFITPSNEI
jgi:hypothetical protein